MGAYSPVAVATPALLARARTEVLLPALEEMRRRDTPYSGVLYAGLMVDRDGTPWVVEFNCRLGDPETQVVLPLVEGGLTDAFWKVAHGEGVAPVARRAGEASVTTVLASRGYPDRPEQGAAIRIPEELPAGVTVFHAGTARGPDGVLRVNGGRVLNVTAVAPTFPEAQRLSRETAEAIEFEGKIFRRDIGWREAARAWRGRRSSDPLDLGAMPELPEVETIVRDIRPALVGRQLGRVSLSHDDILSGVTRRTLVARPERRHRALRLPAGEARGARPGSPGDSSCSPA